MTRWEYYHAYCWFKVIKRSNFGDDVGHWAMMIGDLEYEMPAAMTFMGQQGWELVALHQLAQSYGGQGAYERLTYFYVFKRPLAE
jgi:hypothetical protein